MSGSKLATAVSVYVRTATATATTTSLATPRTKPYLALHVNRQVISVIREHGWRITPCALLFFPAHDKSPSKNLGFSFRAHRKSSPFSCARALSSSSEDKSGFSGSGSSSRLGLVADMGSEGKEHECFENDVLRHKQSSSPLIQNQQQSSKLLTLPTILTLGRVAAVPLLVGTFYSDGWWGTTATTSIFIAAAITDWLDGYLARKMKLKSTFGAFLDPVADKLMVAAALVLLCTRPLEPAIFGQIPWLLTVPSIAIIGREITMSAVREWAASQNSKLSEAVAVNNLGKWKTATQMTALTILLATRDSSNLGGPSLVVGSGVALLYISAGLAVWSLVVYMRKIWSVLLR
ncbi:CDP-diacylglycerol--glycerol-3-phosphate 3-phosphatidyltransferase [Quillaja saponaria]|uniref:CDP-diacylglycerol--glycerol-3-phosphate 1-phosphatidyltransferase n=1 Tax=Quillaja saponaria TaxID=32244 RepID=A0AAD7PYX0_QUISA|nr:CDP-diacylglycerol--glycerol-3-phosphate 3-phosphatidyltransferase [Quillaja saponaria]